MTFAQPFKDYEILERIGSGAMGTVFKARQKRLDRIVALKVLKPALARNTKFVERLRREARIVASLNHPDIIAGYDLGEEGGYHFFVMEFVEGKSLATLLKEWGAFPEEQVLDVATRVASALDHAFKKGVIHRDVKPGNILIDANGRAKLTDMGLAKAPEDVTITQEGATVGTPSYISPEQARDPSRVDVRSDLYSLGATMYHMCTGQPPFVGSTLANVIHDVVYERAPSVTALNPALSDGLSLVIRKLLAKDPDLRYQTPADLLQDLARVRRAERPDVDVAALAAERAPGRRALAGALWAAGAVAVAGVALAIAWPRDAAPVQRPDPAQAFLARVRTEVAAAEGWRGKLRALARAEGAASGEAERRGVADLEAGVLIPWQDDVIEFVRERRGEVEAFVLRPETWRDPARALRASTLEAFEREFAITRPELPAALGQVLDRELRKLDDEAAAATAQRDRNLVAAYRNYLQDDVAKRWRTALAEADFAAAERAVRSASEGFFGSGGRPRRELLEGQTRADVHELEQASTIEALAQIAQAEAASADSLQRAVEEGLAAMRTDLRDDADPYVVSRRFDAWQADLRARHPGERAFRPGADPWPRVASAEAEFRTVLGAARAAADRRRVSGNVQLALGALIADGDAAQEVRWLREHLIADEDVQDLRGRWADLLDAAHAARTWLLEALEVRLGGRAIPVGVAHVVGRTLPVAVQSHEGGPELVERDAGRARRVSLASLRVGELLDQVPPPAGAAAEDIARGLALWLYCAGESSAAARRLPAVDMAFFGEHVVPAVQAVLRLRQGDEPAARESLAQLRRTYQELPVVELRSALDEFERRFGHTAVAHASVQNLADLRSFLRTCEQRRDTLAGLRSAVGKGLTVGLEPDGLARVTCDPSRGETPTLAKGWTRQPDRLVFDGDDVRLEGIRHQALVLEDALSTEHGVVFRGTLGFGAQGVRPRLYLLEVHGVGVALGLTAGGEPVGAVVSLEDLAREKVLHRELERELDRLVEPRAPLAAGAPVVLAGARHELVVEVVVQASRLRARVALDGIDLDSASVPKPPKSAARVLLMPMQPLTVWRAAIEGQP